MLILHLHKIVKGTGNSDKKNGILLSKNTIKLFKLSTEMLSVPICTLVLSEDVFRKLIDTRPISPHLLIT